MITCTMCGGELFVVDDTLELTNVILFSHFDDNGCDDPVAPLNHQWENDILVPVV